MFIFTETPIYLLWHHILKHGLFIHFITNSSVFSSVYLAAALPFISIRCSGACPTGRAVWSPSPTEIAGSNPTGAMDICLLWVLYFVR